jgi:F-type H+-transporting ATPase subunit delta
MITEIDAIAKKYAIAYLNLYFNKLTEDIIKNLAAMKKFLYKNKNFYAYLCIPRLSLEMKLDFVDRLCKAFRLTKNEIKLMHVLIEQKRIDLLDAILKRIIEEYHVKKGIVLLKACTSHEANDIQKGKITSFIQRLIKKDIVIDFYIDKNLINGIRIKDTTLLWEHSVRKHLKKLKNNLYQQVEL